MNETLLNIVLIFVFVLIGGVFAAAEMALVSLRESQINTSLSKIMVTDQRALRCFCAAARLATATGFFFRLAPRGAGRASSKR